MKGITPTPAMNRRAFLGRSGLGLMALASLLNPGLVHVHDLHATLLHLLGIDHLRLSVKFQGFDIRLTNVSGNVLKDLIV